MNPILNSLRRGLLRIIAMSLIGAVLLTSSHLVPLLLGPTLAPLAFGFGLCFLGLAVGDVALRILQPAVDPQAAARDAISQNSTGSGLVYLGRCILTAVILMLIVTAPRAAEPPAAATVLLPVLKSEQQAWWPSHPMPSALGAQVEQETCPSLKHWMCWNPRAQLKTAREQGVGLGQITRTWRPDGSTRFDALAEMREQFPRALSEWGWTRTSLYDPRLQLRGLILMDLRNWRVIQGAADNGERLAMTLAAYNGGLGGLSSDRRACAGTPGCDPGRWWGHTERTSLKAKAAVPGYGKSFFEINREYVHNVIVVRRVRYMGLEA